MMEVAFSFILNAWAGLAEVHAWADQHLTGSANLAAEMRTEGQILCALESHRLLVYDGQWQKRQNVSVPARCREGVFTHPIEETLAEVEFKSESVSSTPKYSSWDQKVDVKVKGRPAFSLYLRQDKKYVGVHSLTGWALWIERKTGHLRFEYVNSENKVHLRLRASTDMNPLHGELKSIHEVHALHTALGEGQAYKAHVLSGSKGTGFNHVVLQRNSGEWKKILHKCVGAKTCKDPEVSLEEEKLNQFADIDSDKYKDFVTRGRALAFDKIAPEELVPETALFR